MHKLKIPQTVHKTKAKVYLKRKIKLMQVERANQWNFAHIIWVKEDFKGVFCRLMNYCTKNYNQEKWNILNLKFNIRDLYRQCIKCQIFALQIIIYIIIFTLAITYPNNWP